MTAAEDEAFNSAAERGGLTKSAWVRQKLRLAVALELGQPIVNEPRARRESSKLAGRPGEYAGEGEPPSYETVGQHSPEDYVAHTSPLVSGAAVAAAIGANAVKIEGMHDFTDPPFMPTGDVSRETVASHEGEKVNKGPPSPPVKPPFAGEE